MYTCVDMYQQLFIKYIYCDRYFKYIYEQNKDLRLQRVYILVGRQTINNKYINKQINK